MPASNRPRTRGGSDGIRIATLLIGAAAAGIALSAKPPAPLPGAAFGSAVTFRLEVAFTVFLALLLFLTALVHGLVKGVLPISVGGSGLGYTAEAARTLKGIEAAKEAANEVAAKGLTEQVEELRKLGL